MVSINLSQSLSYDHPIQVVDSGGALQSSVEGLVPTHVARWPTFTHQTRRPRGRSLRRSRLSRPPPADHQVVKSRPPGGLLWRCFADLAVQVTGTIPVPGSLTVGSASAVAKRAQLSETAVPKGMKIHVTGGFIQA